MGEQKLVIQLPDGQFKSVTGVEELDHTISIQVSDEVVREKLEAVRDAFTTSAMELAAAAGALEVAANAEHAETQVILANVASLIAAAEQVDTNADQLVSTLQATIQQLTDTQQLIQLMASAMQSSFGGLEDVRSIIQALLNNTAELLSGAMPVVVPADPIGAPKYGTAAAVPGHVETVVASFQVPAGQSYVLAGFDGTGSAEGRWKLHVGADVVLSSRSSPADRTATAHFPARGLPRAAAGVIVKVTIEHPEGGPQDFEATIHGYPIAP